MGNEEIELHATFRGHVQGVGFRWTIQAHAEKKGIKGKVENLANGTVEMIAQGSKEKLQDLVSAIKEDSGNAIIESIDMKYQKIKKVLLDFQIQM